MMRLLSLDDDGNLSLTTFRDNIPHYAILSHTWGQDHEEVSFNDLEEPIIAQRKTGYSKLRFCGEQAAKDALHYFWVDTCCIDKKSSAELSEAINSMFRWYRQATRCYVYLSDISVGEDDQALQNHAWEPALRESRWFTRGWTLQELIAPSSVEIFSKEWKRLGDKKSLERLIHEITGIAVQALQGGDMSQFTVEDRLAWASKRNTTCEEDKAYCLLGLFGIYMPLLYGEGQENALYRLHEEISKRSSMIQHYPATELKTARDLLKSWLQPASVAEGLRELLDQRYAGTCQWIFDTAEFKRWQAGLFTGLWVYGKPGSGKSVLAATLVECLQKAETVTAYFFCKTGDESKSTIASILRTWLWQLLEQLPQFRRLALQYHESESGICGSLESIKDALGKIIAESPKIIHLVVDGIDECESGSASVANLISFLSAFGRKCLVALISRPERWIQKAIYPRMERIFCNVLITNEVTREDLDGWIRACVLEMQLSDYELERVAMKKLQEGADGMFLWARFQMEALEAQFAVEDAKKVLQNELPKDLEATYERLLAKIANEHSGLRRATAFRILQWITSANRPLTLMELDFALGIQIDSQSSPKHRSLMRGEPDVVEACGSFIEITHNGQIQFVHASAKEFLLSKGIQDGFRPSNSPDNSSPSQKAVDAMYIARACITCLSFSDIDEISEKLQTVRPLERQLDRALERYPFLEYAAMNWWKHLSAVPFADEELLQATIHRFIGSSRNTVRWLHLYHYLLEFYPDESRLLDPTAILCWKFISPLWDTHLGPSSSKLFNRWQRWHVELTFSSGFVWPFLHIAAFFNFSDVVKQELDGGLSTELQNGQKFTPLMQAAHGDSLEATQVLLDYGAQVNARTLYGYTAVRYACRNSLSTLPLLLEAGGRADALDTISGQTALHEVASSVLIHPQILDILLHLPYISNIITLKDAKGNTTIECAAAIDVGSLALRVYDNSFGGVGGIGNVGSRSVQLLSSVRVANDLFSAQGVIALQILHQGWQEVGVHEPLDSTYESSFSCFTAWKYEIMRRLLEKWSKLP